MQILQEMGLRRDMRRVKMAMNAGIAQINQEEQEQFGGAGENIRIPLRQDKQYIPITMTIERPQKSTIDMISCAQCCM